MESSKFPGSELWEADPSGVGAENRVVTASREDHASGDSCSSARRQPAAAWETGQGQAGRAQPPQAEPELADPDRGSRQWLEA